MKKKEMVNDDISFMKYLSFLHKDSLEINIFIMIVGTLAAIFMFLVAGFFSIGILFAIYVIIKEYLLNIKTDVANIYIITSVIVSLLFFLFFYYTTKMEELEFKDKKKLFLKKHKLYKLSLTNKSKVFDILDQIISKHENKKFKNQKQLKKYIKKLKKKIKQ